MAVRSFIPIHGTNSIKRLLLEKRLLERHYSFVNAKIVGNTINCTGYFRPSEYSVQYEYKVRYTPNKHPKVFVINPIIQYDDDIHMYSDNSLCLYYPQDFSYTSESNLYNTVIPWTHEWFVFYELYLVTGKWLHPYVEHKKI